MNKWEHRIVIVNQPKSGELDSVLADWGAEGWELVSHTAPSQEYSNRWTFAFKRPVSGG